MNSLRAVGVSAAAVICVLACSPSPGPSPDSRNLAAEQTFRIAVSTDPGSLDPVQNEFAYEAALTRQYTEALLKPTSDLKDVQGAAAESYVLSPDGTKYTFKLRRNARYNDGSPVRAADYVYAWQRILDPRVAAPYADFFTIIKGGEAMRALDPKTDRDKIDPAFKSLGLRAVDDYTFEVTLAEPAAYFKWIAALFNSGPVKKDVIDRYGSEKWATNPDTLITNGPYKVKEFAYKNHYTLVPNPNYWGPKPIITTYTVHVIEDSVAAYAKYKTGELDQVYLPPANDEEVKSSKELTAQLLKQNQFSMSWLYFNNTKAPFDNQKVRMAFAKGFDRNAWISDLQKGRGRPSTTLIPEGMNGHHPEIGKEQDFDPAAAKQLLRESQVSPDVLNSIHFLTRDRPLDKQYAQFFVAQFKTNLGLNVVMDVIDSRTVGKMLRAHTFQIAGPGGWVGDYPDQRDWFDIFRKTDGNNHPAYNNPRFDALVKAADAATDESRRNAGYLQAHQLLVGDAAVGFLHQPQTWLLVKAYVKGQKSTLVDEWPGCLFLPDIYIQKH
jgi:oligopeptide transport system substrate-binding protein